MQSAVISLFQANTQKKCAFSSLLLELQARLNVQKWDSSKKYSEEHVLE
jgi:hypothetical protein